MSSVVPVFYKKITETNLTDKEIPFQKYNNQIPIKVIFREEENNKTNVSYST